MKYKIKENVSGQLVWDYLEQMINDMTWVATKENATLLSVVYDCGSMRRSVIEWMRDNLREQVEDKEE